MSPFQSPVPKRTVKQLCCDVIPGNLASLVKAEMPGAGSECSSEWAPFQSLSVMRPLPVSSFPPQRRNACFSAKRQHQVNSR